MLPPRPPARLLTLPAAATPGAARCSTTLKQEISLEVHILDFNKEVYGEKVYVQIVKFMRKEKKFSSVDELKATIQANIDRWKLFKREMKYGRSYNKTQ